MTTLWETILLTLKRQDFGQIFCLFVEKLINMVWKRNRNWNFQSRNRNLNKSTSINRHGCTTMMCRLMECSCVQVHVGEHFVPPVHHHGQAADKLHQQGQGHAQVCRAGQSAFPLIPSVGDPEIRWKWKNFWAHKFRNRFPFWHEKLYSWGQFPLSLLVIRYITTLPLKKTVRKPYVRTGHGIIEAWKIVKPEPCIRGFLTIALCGKTSYELKETFVTVLNTRVSNPHNFKCGSGSCSFLRWCKPATIGLQTLQASILSLHVSIWASTALHGSVLSLESASILTVMLIRIHLFTLVRMRIWIRIQLPQTMRIRIRKPGTGTSCPNVDNLFCFQSFIVGC